MLGKSATELIERLKTDPSFGARVMAIGDIAGRMKLIHAEGYDCTAEDLEAMEQRLLDHEMDAVAGGLFTGCSFCDGYCKSLAP